MVRCLGWSFVFATVALVLAGCADTGLKEAHGELRASPNPLRFGAISVGRTVVKEIELKNGGVAPLHILSIEAGGDLPSSFRLPKAFDEAIPIGGSRKLEVVFAPEEEKRYRGTVILVSSSGKQQTITVPLDGEGRIPSIACSSRVDFGKVPYNTEKTLPIYCVNGGTVTAEVELQGLHGEDADFFAMGEGLDGNTLEIAVGETKRIDVTFFAKSLGTARAKARMHVIGQEDPLIEIPLVGEGFASDLVAVPPCVHFGPVSPGTSATRTALVANGGDDPVTFEGPALIDASGVFRIVETKVDGQEQEVTVLGPDQMAEITIAFAPRSMGHFSGALRLRNDDAVNSRLEVCLTGIGGGADIRVEPDALDFGRVALGMEVSGRLWVRNVGTTDGGPLEIRGVQSSDPSNFTVSPPAQTEIAVGDPAVPIDVTFRPQSEGSFSATLLISSNDGDEAELMIPLSGLAIDLPPCTYRATPPELLFSSVLVGSTSTLVTSVENEGEDECIFASFGLQAGSSTTFSLPAPPLAAVSVLPGERVQIPVQFHSERAGSFRGELRFQVSGRGASPGRIPLRADAIVGCLMAEPSAVDFGERRLSCPAAVQGIRLVNRCADTVQVTAAAFGEGSYGEGEFQVSSMALPFSLAPNTARSFNISYLPVDDGSDAAPFEVQSSAHPLTIAVHGRGTSTDERTDRFRQRDRSPVDILFVIDNSGSMADKQKAVADGCAQFMQYAMAQGIDFHIGVTTTGLTPSTGSWSPCPGGASGGEAGRLFPVDGTRARFVHSGMPNAASVFAQNVHVGICHWLEQGLEASYLALSSPLVDHASDPSTSQPSDGNLGFYRPEARLSVVLISDEDDQSPRPTSFYTSFFRGLKGPGREDLVSVNAVVGKGCGSLAEEGRRYLDVVQATGGLSEPICTEDWAHSLSRLAEQSFGYQLVFPLSGQPEGAVRVRVDGREVRSGWTYVEDANAVIFEQSAAPAPGVSVEITYVPAC